MRTNLNNRNTIPAPKRWNIDHDYLECSGEYYDYDYYTYYDDDFVGYIDSACYTKGFILSEVDGEMFVAETDSETFYSELELYEGYNLDDLMEDVFLDDLDLEMSQKLRTNIAELYPQLYL